MDKDFLKIFKERGFFHQCTDEAALAKLMAKGGVPAYIGFDCTANSLHVGSLVQIMILRMLKKCGQKPIVLLGGATTKVGDPSGKDESRPVLSDEDIAKNMAGISGVFAQFGLDTIETVNNDDWISKLSAMDLIQLGAHFSVNRMLGFDSVKLRLERESHLSLKEFLYMVIQAYDFVELNTEYGCRLQIGGSDQWGNIVNGIELGRRINLKNVVNELGSSEEDYDEDGNLFVNPLALAKKPLEDVKKDAEKNELYGLTTPLITTSSGAKMGKTAQGAVWLTADRVSAYDYWQFWRNTEDSDVGRFLRLFTELPIDEIEKLEALEGAEINSAKIILANEATKICHGEAAAKAAEETAQKTFEQGGVGDELPVIEIAKAELEEGIPAFKILQQAGLVDSGKAAKRLIQGGGAKINDEKIEDEMRVVNLSDINGDGVIKLSSGKKKHALVKVV